MLAELIETIAKAQLRAVQKLAHLLETVEDPKELRRIATALLKLKLPTEPASPATGGGGDSSAARIGGGVPPSPDPRSQIRDPKSTPHHSPPPLTTTELTALSLALPYIPRHKFIHENSPTYWREALALHVQSMSDPERSTPATPIRAGPQPQPA